MPVNFDLNAAGQADLHTMNSRTSGVVAQSFNEIYQTLANGTVLGTSGVPYCQRMPCWDGMVVSAIDWLSSSQTPSGMTNKIFWIADAAGALLRQTNDDGAASWTVSTWKKLNLTSSYTFTYTGYCYAGIAVAYTTTGPSLSVRSYSATLAAITPVSSGNSSATGITSTAPSSLGTITAVGSQAMVRFWR